MRTPRSSNAGPFPSDRTRAGYGSDRLQDDRMRRFTRGTRLNCHLGGGLWNCRPQKGGSVNRQPTQVEGLRGVPGRLQLGLRKDICPPAAEPLHQLIICPKPPWGKVLSEDITGEPQTNCRVDSAANGTANWIQQLWGKRGEYSLFRSPYSTAE